MDRLGTRNAGFGSYEAIQDGAKPETVIGVRPSLHTANE